MKGRSLRLRLLLAGAVSVLAALALSALGLTLLFERHVERRIEAELRTDLTQVVAGLDRNADGKIVMIKSAADPRFERPLSGLYWQVEAEDITLRSRSLWDAELSLPNEAPPDGTEHRHRIADGPAGEPLIVIERHITLPQRLQNEAVTVAVAIDAGEIDQAARAFRTDLLPYLGLLALFLIGAAYAQVAVGLSPLAAIRDRLSAIRAGRATRLDRSFPREIQPLATEIDALLDARGLQIKQARARAADLAHGLKTPLQVLAGDVERLRARGEAPLADEIEALLEGMRRHVDRELTRTRIATGNPDARADLAQAATQVMKVLARTPEGGRLAWKQTLPEGLVARIDPDDLAEALGNLMENAARHARTAIAITARREGDRILLRIIDDGPGIPAAKIDDALKRGVRLDRGGGAAGLGLAIVQDIAEAWGARLTLENTAQGFTAGLSLPAASDACT